MVNNYVVYFFLEYCSSVPADDAARATVRAPTVQKSKDSGTTLLYPLIIIYICNY